MYCIFKRRHLRKDSGEYEAGEKGGKLEMELEKLQQIIAEVLNVDASEVMPGTTFTDDLGADSLDLYQIILGVEDAFDIEIPQEEAEKIVTVGDAVELIQRVVE